MEMQWQPTPVFLPGKFHGQRSLADYTPQGRKKSDMTEQLILILLRGFEVVLVVKNPAASAGDVRDTGFIPWSERPP